MATARDLNFVYTTIDRLFRLSIGEQADFSGAMYDGDFTLSLEAAQRRKHEFVADRLDVVAGTRVLDLGCGWGPFLEFVRRRGAAGVGVTLSRGQAAACRRHGLDVHVMDCRAVTRDTFGGFDAVASLGAFEHFCSREEFAAGRAGGDLRQTVQVGAYPAARGRAILPPDHGVRAEHDPAGADEPRCAPPLGRPRAGADAGDVSGLLAALGARAARCARRRPASG